MIKKNKTLSVDMNRSHQLKYLIYLPKDYLTKKYPLVLFLHGAGERGINLKDIEISNDRNGKPFYLKSQKIDKIILSKFKVKKYNLFLSISDENDYSIAFTMLQTK